MEQRLNTGNAFLWVDEEAERLQRVRAGEIIVSPVGPRYPKRVPDGLIHDWAGAAFIHDATLRDVLQVVRSYGRYKDLYQPTVIESRVKDASANKRSFFDAAHTQVYISEDGPRRRLRIQVHFA